MERLTGKLTAVTILNLKAPGKPGRSWRYRDRRGLYLQVHRTKDGGVSRSWVLRCAIGGESIHAGLGDYPRVSIADARAAASALIVKIKSEGINPLTEKWANAEAAAKQKQQERNDRKHTFGSVAKEWCDKQHIKTAAHAKYRGQVESQLTRYCESIWKKAIRLVDEDDVAKCLSAMKDKAPTAKRLRNYMESILDYAASPECKYRDAKIPNPARIEAMKFSMPNGSAPKRVKPMKPEEMPAFAAQVRAKDGIKFRALEFLMLTNVDPNNVVAARWSEIEGDIWTTRKTKGRGELFEVPLSAHATALLKSLPRENGNDFVFVGTQARKGIGINQIGEAMKAIPTGGVTPRGLRPTFKTWAQRTSFKFDVIEHAMRHKVGDDVERRYDHNTWVDERRKLMETWAQYLDGTGGGNVIQLRA